MRPQGWAILATVEEQVEPSEVRWWDGRAAQVRAAIDSLETARQVACACPVTTNDYRGRTVYCDAPRGFPHRFGGALLLTRRVGPAMTLSGPTLASLGLVPASTITAALGGPARVTGGRR